LLFMGIVEDNFVYYYNESDTVCTEKVVCILSANVFLFVLHLVNS